MTWCKTFALVLTFAFLTLGTAKSLDNQHHHLGSTLSKSQITDDDAVVSSNVLHILSKSLKKRESEQEEQNSHHKQQKETQNNKNETLPPTADDSDYFFLPEKFPDLPKDEYLDIDEDSTPFDFLKQNDLSRKEQIPTQSLSPTNNASNAIYITVPIFINTAANGTPLSLSVGGQAMPLNNNSPPSNVKTAKRRIPTSKFNKLAYRLNPIRMPVLPEFSLNRHRSFGQGRNRVRKHKNPIRNYDKYIYFITRPFIA